MVCRRIGVKNKPGTYFGGGARNCDVADSESAYAAAALLCMSRAQKSGSHEIDRSALKH
jgi:hypothetical protein